MPDQQPHERSEEQLLDTPTGPDGEPLPDFLAEVIARHFPEGRVERPGGGVAIAQLGLGGIRVHCPAPRSITDQGGTWAVMLTVSVSGGAFGESWQAVNLSGYGETPAHAVSEAGCVWACSFGALLRTAFAGEPLADLCAERDVVLDGRPFRVLHTAVDRWAGDHDAGAAAARAVRDACGGWLTSAVLASGALPVLAGDSAVTLGSFLGVVTEPLPEVTVHGGDWPPALPALTRAAAAAAGQIVLLRDHAILLPQSPFQGFQRESLARTLTHLAASRPAAGQAAGWRGWRHHGGRLGPPVTNLRLAELREAAGGPLPPAYEHFVTTVAASGAGPGYGLQSPVVHDSVIVLAVAGCGIHWELRLAGEGRGEVWLDAQVLGESPHPVAASFTEWYAAWLDAAIRDDGPWRQWDNSRCSPVAVLSQVFEQAEHDNPSRAAERVRELAGDVTVTVRGSGGLDDRVLDPCHPCVALYAEFDCPESAFAIGYPTHSDPGPSAGSATTPPTPTAEPRRRWNRLWGKG
jgi:hypothetical protein